MALVLARIRNWKLVFFGFFWHRPWPTFEIGNWFFGLRWFFFWIFWFFFWYLDLGLEYHPKKYQKKTKKNQKKTSRYTKIGKLAWFFWFFLVFFWGEHPPPPLRFDKRTIHVKTHCQIAQSQIANLKNCPKYCLTGNTSILAFKSHSLV